MMGDLTAVSPLTGNLDPINPGLSSVGARQTDQDADGRRLASAIGPQKSKD
jgi:hypothetical protein